MLLRQIVEEDRCGPGRQQEVNLRFKQDGPDAAQHSITRPPGDWWLRNIKSANLRRSWWQTSSGLLVRLLLCASRASVCTETIRKEHKSVGHRKCGVFKGLGRGRYPCTRQGFQKQHPAKPRRKQATEEHPHATEKPGFDYQRKRSIEQLKTREPRSSIGGLSVSGGTRPQNQGCSSGFQTGGPSSLWKSKAPRSQ